MLKTKKNNLNLSAWMFIVLSFGFIVYMSYKSKDNYNLTEIHEKTKGDNESLIETENEYSLNFNQNNSKEIDYVDDNETVKEIEYIDDNEVAEELENIFTESDRNLEYKGDIFVNKIVISKNIDKDNESNTYREPIDAFKTISTLDESVIKEIDYYPSLFVWTSVNTENISLKNEEEIFKPMNLSMIVKCNGEVFNEYNYNVTANTPRWREWIEIDLQNIDDKLLNQFWSVEIVDNTNNSVLESRDFKLVKDKESLEQLNELTLKKENVENDMGEIYLETE